MEQAQALAFHFRFPTPNILHQIPEPLAAAVNNRFLTACFPGKHEDCFSKADLLLVCRYKHTELSCQEQLPTPRGLLGF